MGKATQQDMEDLHGLTAQLLAARIRSGEASPADIAQAVKFLKDNHIEVAVGAPNKHLKALTVVLPFPSSSTEGDTDEAQAV